MFLTLTAVLIVAAALSACASLQSRQLDERYPPQGDFVEVEGLRIHYVDRPAREPVPGRPPLVLIHGASGNVTDSLAALEEVLGDRNRLIAIDRPGHGWSERPEGREAAVPLSQARIIHLALAEMGVEEAVLLGHSMGGAVSLAHAIAYPEATAGLVLLAPVSHPWVGGVAWYYHVSANPLLGPLFNRIVVAPFGGLVAERAAEGAFRPQEPPENYVERTGVARVLRPPNWRANAEDIVDVFNAVVWQQTQYPMLAMPVSVVAGDEDPTVATDIHAMALERQIPDAELTLLEGVGHMVHYAAPDAVRAAVESVAGRIARRRGAD